MKIGLLGLPGSGKTTVFRALTGLDAPLAGRSRGKTDPNVGVVKVLDQRLDHLREIYRPRKTVYAVVEFADLAGLVGEAAGEEAFSLASLAALKNVDAVTLVLRNFANEFLPPPTPIEDLRRISEELLLLDLVTAETRLERIQKGYSKGPHLENLVREEKVLRRIAGQLEQNRPIREMELSGEENKMIRGFQFLTQKPLMAILNSDERVFGKNEGLLAQIEETCKAVEFAGQFEMELSRLEEQEARLFMEDMGIGESAQGRLTTLAYDTLGYLSFFTVGSDEVRAWNVRKGETALDAAATIHSDLARGFIRAECFSYEDCVRWGSEKEVRQKGLFRLEGKDYRVRDGDILSIRFNV